jgi:TonB family protein
VNDTQKGITISILLHGIVLAALLASWIDKPMHPRTVSLDFTILNFQEHGVGIGALNGGRQGETGPNLKNSQNLEKPIKHQVDVRTGTTTPAAEYQAMSTLVSDGASGTSSDKDGHVEVYGKASSSPGEGENGAGVLSSVIGGQASPGGGYGGGEGRTVRYGTGSSDEKAFHYIREDILKNVKYPEKARRKGIAGRILLSFTISESGLTRDVKVINSSGFTELDNSARDAVIRTAFSQRIPYRLYVILPIEYKLE